MLLRKPAAWVLTLAGCLVAGAAHAEVTGLRMTLSPYAGVTLWDQTVKVEENAIYGGRLGILWGRYLGLEGTYGFSPTEGTDSPGADVDFHHIGADVIVHLTPPHRVTPYVAAGWSRQILDPEPQVGNKQTYDGYEVAAGLKTKLAERVNLRFDARDLFSNARKGPQVSENWIHDFVFSLGFDFVIGGKISDLDQDGITDNKDRCPDTPLGATVDAMGCPMDSDADGVYDGIDQCANTARNAKVDAKGCPTDSDGDGVADGPDQCPNTPRGAKVDPKGCPLDGDNDGVPDGIDQCANTPAGAKVDANGCPMDTDGDGVADGVDQCANTPKGARVDSRGCPIEISERETQFLDTGLIRLEDVNFDTGKAVIKPESYGSLDKIGKILSDWPQLQVEVGGHTDSQGSATSNQKLSESRAAAVEKYLEDKFPGINKDQLTSKGYGESQPVADNKTAKGRATNRRVEIKVLNTDVLKKEVEKRKMLQH